MTKTKKQRNIQSTIDILKNEFNSCENYNYLCPSCHAQRIVQDLEEIKDLIE